MKTIKKIIKNLKKEKMIDTSTWKDGYYENQDGEIIITLNRNIACTELVASRIAENFGKKGYKAYPYASHHVAIKPQKLLDSIDACFDI